MEDTMDTSTSNQEETTPSVGEKRPLEEAEEPLEKKQKLSDTDSSAPQDDNDATIEDLQVSAQSTEVSTESEQSVAVLVETETIVKTETITETTVEPTEPVAETAPTSEVVLETTETTTTETNIELKQEAPEGEGEDEAKKAEVDAAAILDAEDIFTAGNEADQLNFVSGGEFPFHIEYTADPNATNGSLPVDFPINSLSNPLKPLTPVTRRRRPSQIEEDEDPDPESKWSKNATEKLVGLYNTFGKRKIIDDKFHDEIIACFSRGANPTVPVSPDGNSFYTFLSVGAECGDQKLVQHLLDTFPDEFSAFDKGHALQYALKNREQEIADLLINRGAPINREIVMEMFDIKMSDDLKRKTLPLKALLKLVDEGKFPPEDLFLPELLNRAIYADNVAALKLLFTERNSDVLPLLEQATPVNKTIRAGRGKTLDIGEGVPPLTYAAIMERGNCLEVFLECGANPNFSTDEMGGTLLHIVAYKGNVEMIELLLQYNADPRIINSRNQDVLSRTRGRKARKHVRDAVAILDQKDRELSGNLVHNLHSLNSINSVLRHDGSGLNHPLSVSPLQHPSSPHTHGMINSLPGMSTLVSSNSPFIPSIQSQMGYGLQLGHPGIPQIPDNPGSLLSAQMNPLHDPNVHGVPPASSIINPSGVNSPFSLDSNINES